MGTYDFVVGIFVGIGLAALALVVQTSRVPAVRASYSGEIAGSTVRRNTTQKKYLRAVGQQIHVTKLAGYLFFGTIVSVEDRLRTLIQDEVFNETPIRFLILDLSHVSGIDYSAAEAFSRISRIFSQKGVTLYVSGVDAKGPLGSSLISVGLLSQEGIEVTLFEDLNSALESCENELLKTFYANKDARSRRNGSTRLDVPGQDGSHVLHPTYSIDAQFSSPRFNHLHRSAISTLEQQPPETRYHNFKEPLKLILQTFQGLTEKKRRLLVPRNNLLREKTLCPWHCPLHPRRISQGLLPSRRRHPARGLRTPPRTVFREHSCGHYMWGIAFFLGDRSHSDGASRKGLCYLAPKPQELDQASRRASGCCAGVVEDFVEVDE